MKEDDWGKESSGGFFSIEKKQRDLEDSVGKKGSF